MVGKETRVTYTHLEAERALIATLFTDALARERVFANPGSLEAQQFSIAVLGQAFTQLEGMYLDGVDVSFHALHERIERSGYKVTEKDNLLLNEVCGVVEASSDYLACIELIQNKYIARQTQQVLARLGSETAAAFRGDEVGVALDAAQQRLEDLQSQLTGRKKVGSLPLSHYLAETIDDLETLSARKDDSPVTGVPTGLVRLDNLTTGWHGGDLIVVGARPSMGKTALLLRMADAASTYQSKEPGAVVIYSMEMLGSQLVKRYLSMKARVNLQAMRTGKLSDEDWPRIVHAMEEMKRLDHLCLCEQAVVTASFIRADLRQKKKKYGRIAFVGVDYLQLMQSPLGARSNENRANEVSGFSRELKRIAVEEKCPVVALSQLNRSVETRPNKRPLMSDLRDSGGIEQDADVIAFLYRDEYYNPDSKDKGKLEIILSKQRNGPPGVVYTAFDGRYTLVDNLATWGAETDY